MRRAWRRGGRLHRDHLSIWTELEADPSFGSYEIRWPEHTRTETLGLGGWDLGKHEAGDRSERERGEGRGAVLSGGGLGGCRAARTGFTSQPSRKPWLARSFEAGPLPQ